MKRVMFVMRMAEARISLLGGKAGSSPSVVGVWLRDWLGESVGGAGVSAILITVWLPGVDTLLLAKYWTTAGQALLRL